MRLPFIVALLLGTAATAQATPFTPNVFSLIILGNPNTFCIDHCADADPSNDATTLLTFNTPSVFGVGVGFGPIDRDIVAGRGSWLATADASAGSFSLDVLLALWDTSAPDLVSVTPGQITGTFGRGGFGLIEGHVNTAYIHAVSLVYPFTPGVPENFILLIDRPSNPVFTPMPEPATVFLLGSGLVALVRRKRGGIGQRWS